MSKISIKQHDNTDCGATCLASISAYYKLELPIARIRQYANTDKRGTNILGLVSAAQKLGFDSKGVKGDFESLFKIPIPAIAHIVIEEQIQHYVVIYKVDKKNITIMDPNTGKIFKKTHEEFEKDWTKVLVILLPGENFVERNEKISTLKRFWFLLKPHKMVLLQALIGSIIYTLLGLSTSIYIQKITDFVLVGGNVKLLNLLGVLMLLLLILQIFLGIFKDIFITKTVQQIDSRLILGYYKHLLKLPQQFFNTMQVGEIISRISDAVKIREFINTTSLIITVNIFIVIFSFILMFSYYWKLALIMLGVIPLYIIIYWISNILNRKAERKLMEDGAKLESQLVESLSSIGTIKQFGLESFVNIKTENRFISVLYKSYFSSLNSIFSNTSTHAVSRLFVIILLWSGSYFVINKKITPGELMSFYAIIGYFTGPIMVLISANKNIQGALIAADRLFEIFDIEIEEQNNKIKLTPSKIDDIKFKNISFQYSTRVEIFKNFNLTIKKGEITAILGESGSGKSTLISIFQKLYPIQDGNILIGDLNLKNIDNESLRKLIGVVPQKLDLFSGSLIDNIAVGDFEPNIDRILSICKEIDFLVSLNLEKNEIITKSKIDLNISGNTITTNYCVIEAKKLINNEDRFDYLLDFPYGKN